MSNKSTGEFIKELRKEKGMSQQKLSELTRIDRTTITKYETGEREPNYYNLEILSEVLEVSVTELIAGGRKIKDYNKIDNALKRMFVKMRKFKNVARVLVSIFALVIMSLIVYILVLNYTSTKVYKVYANSEDICITDGLLVKTKDRMYLTFTNENLSDEVDQINIYYKIDDQKEYLLKSSKLDSIYFSKRINIREYNVKNFNKFLKNTYVELESRGKIIGIVKLIIEFDYSNKNIDNGDSDIDPQAIDINNINRSEIYDLANKFIINNQNKIYNIKHNGINYEIYIMENEIKIVYIKNNIKYTLKYNNYNGIENISLQKFENSSQIVYSYYISDEKCEISKCDRYKSDLALINLLLEKIKN